MLFGISTHQRFGIKSSTTNWYDTEQATNLLDQMQTLARNTRRQVARLQVQENQLTWLAQSGRLVVARYDVNKIGADLLRLDQMKKGLEPWQRSLVHKVTPEVHEMVYQLDAAIAHLKKHENKSILALTQYPQNINVIYKQANRMAGTIGTVSQYVQAEQRMATLEHHTARASS
ncbi:MAG: hypothetical protein P8Z30_15255 [Acidobacteriota bacterium]